VAVLPREITVKGEWHQRWSWGAASHLGGRSEQQDRWGVFSPSEGEGLLALVADGLGGHRDGALAAQVVIDAAKDFIGLHAEMLRVQPQKALAMLCEQAHTAVTTVSIQAHSTIVALWLCQDQAYWMHVGDSRFYHLRAGRRLLRTRDHSAAQMLMELGEISEAEIAGHPDQNRLYRSLGSGTSPKPEIGCGSVMANDLLVLCSDGVWAQVSEAELWAAHTGRLKMFAKALVEKATARGGAQADNATLVLIRPLPEEAKSWIWLRWLLPRR
jgi:serine/threonine protein phosphatase PrpC